MLTLKEIKSRLLPVFKQSDVSSAILFGSYAKGTADEKSDIDLIVDTELKGLKFMELYCDVQDALDGVSLDMFAVREVVPGGRADQEISKWGKVIY